MLAAIAHFSIGIDTNGSRGFYSSYEFISAAALSIGDLRYNFRRRLDSSGRDIEPGRDRRSWKPPRSRSLSAS